MPDITGTSGDDEIEVTDDNGTLNGVPQGTPINQVSALAGDDDIAITNSTISGSVRANAGNDEVTLLNSTVGGVLHAGSGSDTVTVSGSSVGRIRLGGGNDTLNFSSTDVTGDIRGNGGTDSLNLPVGTVVNDDTFGTFTVASGVGYSLSSGSFTLPSGKTVTYLSFENGTGFPCFTRDTLIQAEHGATSVQALAVGDRVPTVGNGVQPIRWIGRRTFQAADLHSNPKRFPVRIMAGALGAGLPARDLLVSRQHRMLVCSRIALRMFGQAEVLIPAIKLTALPGVYVDEGVAAVEYYHLLFDRHEIIHAENTPTESLFTGPEALRSLGPEARREILDIFPELANSPQGADPARYIPKGRQQARLIARHLRNDKPLLQAF